MADDVILAINPGTTTTRCALFVVAPGGVTPLVEETLEHDEARMAGFESIAGQLPFRRACIEAFLADHLGDGRLVACAGRGGMLTPVPAGVIAVNADLVDVALNRPVHRHASNLGAPLADAVARPLGLPAFIVDPVSVDELAPVARVSGFEDIPRFSFVHALNIRASARRLAAEQNKAFDDLRCVVAHLGAGISVATLLGGRLVDSSNRMEISPFSPERAGGLPPLPLIELCYSGAYTREALLRKLYGEGGVFGYLGTRDMRKVEAMIDAGDDRAALILEAMIYQIAKAIGTMASVACFDLDGIVLTGGMAQSARIVSSLRDRIGGLAPVTVYPGSDECRALAEGAARALSGAETPMTWPVAPRPGPEAAA